MKYFAIQVKTKSEEKFLKLAKSMLDANDIPPETRGNFLWPRRRLLIRRKGKSFPSLAPIFPGYIFLEAEDIPPDLYWTLRRTEGFLRFLKNNHNIEALSGTDKALLLHFLSFGEIVERSTVYFDVNNRIRVMKGPLKGLEGQIIKVDKRKRRAKIKLNMYSENFTIDFGFELLEHAGTES